MGQKGNEEKGKGKIRERGKEKERQGGQNILKNYRVTMKILNRKAKSIVRKMFVGKQNEIIRKRNLTTELKSSTNIFHDTKFDT